MQEKEEFPSFFAFILHCLLFGLCMSAPAILAWAAFGEKQGKNIEKIQERLDKLEKPK